MRKIVVISAADARPGFALAGVRQFAGNTEDLPAALRGLARDPSIGAMIVDERLVTGAAQAQLRLLERRWTGLVIVLPAPVRPGRGEEEDYVLQLIRRAIGYQVRLGS